MRRPSPTNLPPSHAPRTTASNLRSPVPGLLRVGLLRVGLLRVGLLRVGLLGAALAVPAACTVDPDEDFPPGTWPDASPRPDTADDDTADDTDPGDTTDDTDPGDTDPDASTGGPCDGHCDCSGNEYCAATGTCQLIIVSGPYYCCTDDADACPSGQPCHIPGEVGSGGVCGEELPGDPEAP